MKKMFLILVLMAGFTMTAQETTQKEEETSKVQLEKLESLLAKLSEKMVVASSSESNDSTANLSTLISALEKLENKVQTSGKFQNLILKTDEIDDNVKTSYSIAVTSDKDESIQIENFEELQGMVAELAIRFEKSEMMKELIAKLATSDLVKELATKKKE